MPVGRKRIMTSESVAPQLSVRRQYAGWYTSHNLDPLHRTAPSLISHRQRFHDFPLLTVGPGVNGIRALHRSRLLSIHPSVSFPTFNQWQSRESRHWKDNLLADVGALKTKMIHTFNKLQFRRGPNRTSFKLHAFRSIPSCASRSYWDNAASWPPTRTNQ